MERFSATKAVSSLTVGACLVLTCSTASTETTGYASESGVVFCAPLHSEEADLLPAIPYSEFIDRAMRFLLVDQDTWFKGDCLRDASGMPLPPFLKHAKLSPSGRPYSEPVVDRGVVYPAFHHAISIETCIRYYIYSGDMNALQCARRLADWNIAHSTPHEWPYGDLPYSTFVNGVPGGFVDGDAIMTDKPAIMALAYIRLYRVTRDEAYLLAAGKIADTLARSQRAEGNWPFRVNPTTAQVREEYTSSAIYGAMLFEALDDLSGNSEYRDHRDRAVRWVLANPVKTMDWRGFYEDVGSAAENRTNWDCIDTVRYLVAHRDTIPGAMETAERLNRWIAETFIERDHMFAPAAGVREQLVCFSIMGGHAIHWAAMMADLHEVSGDQKQRWEVMQALNFVTYLIQPDNRIVVGAEHGLNHPQGAPYWYSCQFSCVNHFLDILGTLPELAPDNETHLLKAAGEVRDVQYSDSSVSYISDAAGTDVLKLSFAPREVRVSDHVLPVSPAEGQTGWVFDERTRVLRVMHGAGRVAING